MQAGDSGLTWSAPAIILEMLQYKSSPLMPFFDWYGQECYINKICCVASTKQILESLVEGEGAISSGKRYHT